MYVKTTRDELQRLKTPEMERIAVFSSNNMARVPKADGEVLIAKDDFEEYKQE